MFVFGTLVAVLVLATEEFLRAVSVFGACRGRVTRGRRGAVARLRRRGAVGFGGRAVPGGRGSIAASASIARLVLVIVSVQQQVDDENCKREGGHLVHF